MCSKELLIFNKLNQILLIIKFKRKIVFKGDRRWVNLLNILVQYILVKDMNLNQFCCVIYIIMVIYVFMVVMLVDKFYKSDGYIMQVYFFIVYIKYINWYMSFFGFREELKKFKIFFLKVIGLVMEVCLIVLKINQVIIYMKYFDLYVINQN